MKSIKWAAGLLTVSGLCGIARGDFNLSFTAEPDAPAPGLTRYEFFARNDGNHGSGVRLLDMDIELRASQPMVVGTFPRSGKLDLTGSQTTDPYHSDRSFINILGDPSSDSDSVPNALWVVEAQVRGTAPGDGGVMDFDVSGAHLDNHGVIATSAVNAGHGALFAVAVVPSSTSFIELIPWGLGGESGPAFGDFTGGTLPIGPVQPDPNNFTQIYALVVPEPGMASVGIGALMLLRRRRTARKSVAM